MRFTNHRDIKLPACGPVKGTGDVELSQTIFLACNTHAWGQAGRQFLRNNEQFFDWEGFTDETEIIAYSCWFSEALAGRRRRRANANR